MLMLAMEAGLCIKALRGELGLAQRELSDRAGVSRAALSRLESGRMTAVQTDTIERLVVAMGRTARLVVGGDAPTDSGRSEERLRQSLRLAAQRERHLRLALGLCADPRAAKADIRRAQEQVRLWKARKSCSPRYIERWNRALAGAPKDVARAMTSFDDWENAMFQNTPWAFKWS